MSIPNTSITSTDSFAMRAQHSESRRVALWMFILIGMLALTLARRAAGGIVMTHTAMFVPYAAVLVIGIGWQVVLFRILRRANSIGYLLPDWLWRASAVIDLAIPTGLLSIAAFLSPRGAVPALSEPPLLLFPIVILMSVLRLKPKFTLYKGLAAALILLLLAVRAIVVTKAPTGLYPVYLAYGCILMLAALAATLVAREVKAHVVEAAKEAAAHERVDRQIFGMERDLSVARDIQLGLFPAHAPELAGFEIIGMNRPAQQTGGDYYDWQELIDGRLTVVLADVAGHGIGPTLVMAICRAYARSITTSSADPAAFLTRLNALIFDDLPADRFITLVMAVLAADGTVQLISAGHGPTFLYRAATGEITQFIGDGVPLGITPTEEYGPTNILSLGTGDVLVMLTDGFCEWSRPNDDEQIGIKRLQETLRTAAEHDAKTILRMLDEAVCRFCQGSQQSDDMTAIVIKRTKLACSCRHEPSRFTVHPFLQRAQPRIVLRFGNGKR